MRDTDYNSLRREFLGVGLTGAMAGLAGCSNVIGSDDEEPNIDTAGFNFSYDEVARQVEIEFISGAAIDAGNVQIRHDAGREVLWAELGSTTAGPQEDIEAGAVAVLGPEILNWEAPIESGKTIRLIYTGKETPATLERYAPPGETDTSTEKDSENTSLTTVFEDGFEDGEYANDWSIVWQNFGDREPTNEWSITQNNALSGDYSLYLDSNGDPNIVATNDRIIELDKDFELTVEYYVPDSENRGPSVRLLDTDQNGSKGNYIEAEEANFGRVANSNPPFGQNDIFQLFDSEASVASSSINESHQIQVTRNDDTITGYHDGNMIISIQVDEVDWDLTKDYRLALRNSGRFGGSSEIYFDNVKYSADI